jgi:hypothetical protein
MLLGDASLGNTTIGFSSTQVDISLTSTGTSTYSATVTAGYNLSLAASTTSSLIFNNRVDLSISATTTSNLNSNTTKGINLTIGTFGPNVGEFTLGETSLGYDRASPPTTDSIATFRSTKGISQSLSAISSSSLTIFNRIDLTLSALASSSSTWATTKGVELKYDANTDSTLVLVPDYEEIIGKVRADGTQDETVRSNGERNIIVEAEGTID